MNIGETMTLGRWAGEPIVWRVIDVKDGRALLVSRDILEIRPFHPDDEPIGGERLHQRGLSGELEHL